MIEIAHTNGTAAALGRLSDAESEVMHLIWQQTPPITVSALLPHFTKARGWKTSTLSTILDRLIEKSFLRKELHGKTNHYTPLVSHEIYKEHETHVFLESVHKGSVRSFIAALVSDGIPSDEIKAIQEWFKSEVGDDM